MLIICVYVCTCASSVCVNMFINVCMWVYVWVHVCACVCMYVHSCQRITCGSQFSFLTEYMPASIQVVMLNGKQQQHSIIYIKTIKCVILFIFIFESNIVFVNNTNAPEFGEVPDTTIYITGRVENVISHADKQLQKHLLHQKVICRVENESICWQSLLTQFTVLNSQSSKSPHPRYNSGKKS